MAKFTWEHVHLRSPEPEATAQWYHDKLGADVIRTKNADGSTRIDLNLSGQKVFIAVADPSKTWAPPESPYLGLDHFGMTVADLDSAVKELKGESAEERPAVQLNLGIALRIDESYVPEENQRLRFYKKIAGSASDAAIDDVRKELEDRYGAPPDATVYLLEAARLRLECERVGISQVDRKRGELQIRFTENASIDPARLMHLVSRNAKRGAQFTPQGVLKYPLAATRSDEVLLEIHEVLEGLAPATATASK